MLRVHVLKQDGVLVNEPGDPDNWVQLETTDPRVILDHFKDLAPAPPRIIHLTYTSGEFSADSESELVIDTLNSYISAEHNKQDEEKKLENDSTKIIRVWAYEPKPPTISAQPVSPAERTKGGEKNGHGGAKMMAACDLWALRSRFLDAEARAAEQISEKADIVTSDAIPLPSAPLRETGGGADTSVLPAHEERESFPTEEKNEQELFSEELDDMRRIFFIKDFTNNSSPTIVQQEELDHELTKRLEAVEREFSKGQFGPLVAWEDGAKVYKRQQLDEEGNSIKAIKIKPLALSDTQDVVLVRDNTLAVIDYTDGSRLSEEVLQTRKVGDGFHEYAHLKNTKKSKRFGANVVCWCKQEYKHRVQSDDAPGTMNVDAGFDYLLNAKLLERPDVESYMDDEGRTVRKAKRVQRGVKTSPAGDQEDCWTSWVVKEVKDQLDGGWTISNKQRENRISRKMVHHILHNVVKSKVEEGPDVVTKVTILVVHRIEPHPPSEQQKSPTAEPVSFPLTSSPLNCGMDAAADKTVKFLQDVLDNMGNNEDAQEINHFAADVQPQLQQQNEYIEVEVVPECSHDYNELTETGNPDDTEKDCKSVILDQYDQAEILVNDREHGGEAAYPVTDRTEASVPFKTGTTSQRHQDCDRTDVSYALSTSSRPKSGKAKKVSLVSDKVASKKALRGNYSKNKLKLTSRAFSGDDDNVEDECPPDEFDEMLNELNNRDSPAIPGGEIAELKRRKLQEQLKGKWSNTVARISLGELFLSMPRTTNTHLNAAHTELAQAKMAAMALRYNYGVQEAEQGECPPWCAKRRMM